jgi:hypothetical protein
MNDTATNVINGITDTFDIWMLIALAELVFIIFLFITVR